LTSASRVLTPKKVAAKSFILQGDAEPLSSVPVSAEPSQSLIGMWLFATDWLRATFRPVYQELGHHCAGGVPLLQLDIAVASPMLEGPICYAL
jgi:hypothetical protein